MKCPFCGYVWEERKENPKKCPRCQRWLPNWKKVKEEYGKFERSISADLEDVKVKRKKKEN